MNKNICVISLSVTNRKAVAEAIANSLGMMFLDLDELIDFELADKKKILSECGAQYLSSLEEGIVKRSNEYVNTISTLSAQLYFFGDNSATLKNSNTLFLDYDYKVLCNEVSSLPEHKQLAFENYLSLYDDLRVKMLTNADMHISCTDNNARSIADAIDEIKRGE